MEGAYYNPADYIPDDINPPVIPPEETEDYEDYMGINVPDFISGYNWELERPPGYQGYTPQYTPENAPDYAGYTPQYNVTNAPERSNIDRQALLDILSGRPAYDITPETTEQYYEDVIYDPAMWHYENVTRPGYLESLGSLHGSTRANMERTSREQLGRDLSAQRAQLYYADELARRQSLQDARNLQATGVGLAQGQYGQELQKWQTQNQLGLQEDQLKAQFGLQQWAQESGNWQAFEKFKMDADQFKSNFDFQRWVQDSSNWSTLQQLGMTQEQIQLLIEQAQLNQYLTPYQLMLQALGLQGIENIVYPGSNPFTTGITVQTQA